MAAPVIGCGNRARPRASGQADARPGANGGGPGGTGAAHEAVAGHPQTRQPRSDGLLSVTRMARNTRTSGCALERRRGRGTVKAPPAQAKYASVRRVQRARPPRSVAGVGAHGQARRRRFATDEPCGRRLCAPEATLSDGAAFGPAQSATALAGRREDGTVTLYLLLRWVAKNGGVVPRAGWSGPHIVEFRGSCLCWFFCSSPPPRDSL